MAVTPEHEALHRIFKHDSGLFARIVARALDVDTPAASHFSELNVDLTETRPIDRRADSVLRAEFRVDDPGGDYILIVESQTEPDKTRRGSWPYYITFVQNKYQMDVVLLVVCGKAETARWARKPVQIGRPGLVCLTVTPVVLGPDNVPAITSVEEAAADLPLAVFSALTHARGPKARAILETLAAALDTTDIGIAENLSEFTEVGLGTTPGAQIWKELMATETYAFMSETRAKAMAAGEAKGEARGEAKAVLRVLARRKVTVDDASRKRIESCTDTKTLETWLDRSLTATKPSELFED
jgi:hypothetical protein